MYVQAYNSLSIPWWHCGIQYLQYISKQVCYLSNTASQCCHQLLLAVSVPDGILKHEKVLPKAPKSEYPHLQLAHLESTLQLSIIHVHTTNTCINKLNKLQRSTYPPFVRFHDVTDEGFPVLWPLSLSNLHQHLRQLNQDQPALLLLLYVLCGVTSRRRETVLYKQTQSSRGQLLCTVQLYHKTQYINIW